MFDLEKDIGVGLIIGIGDLTIEEEISGSASGEKIAVIDEGVGSGGDDALLEILKHIENLIINGAEGDGIDPRFTDESEIIF